MGQILYVHLYSRYTQQQQGKLKQT